MKRALLCALALSCGPLDQTPRPKNIRVVTARLVPPASQNEALGGTRAVQLAGVVVKQGQLSDLFVGDAVEARAVTTISVAIPKTESVTLFLQTPKGNAATFGQLVGLVEWDDGHGGRTSRIPAGDDNAIDLDLGELNWETGSALTLADNRLPVAAESNPLLKHDRNANGTNDFADNDDDSDGITDADDPDADGDQLADLDQRLGSLPDANGREDGDGVPDELE